MMDITQYSSDTPIDDMTMGDVKNLVHGCNNIVDFTLWWGVFLHANAAYLELGIAPHVRHTVSRVDTHGELCGWINGAVYANRCGGKVTGLEVVESSERHGWDVNEVHDGENMNVANYQSPAAGHAFVKAANAVKWHMIDYGGA